MLATIYILHFTAELLAQKPKIHKRIKTHRKKRWNTTQSKIWYKICELSGECENPVGTHRKLIQSNWFQSANRTALELSAAAAAAAYDNAVVYALSRMRGRAMGDLYRTAAEASTEHVVPTRSISGRAAAGSWIMQRPRCHPPVHVMLPDMHRGGCGGGVTRKCFRWRQRRFLPSSGDTCVAEFLTTHARAPQDDEAIRGHWRSLHRGLCVFMVEIAARRPTRTAYRHALPSHPLCYKNSTEKWFTETIFNRKD